MTEYIDRQAVMAELEKEVELADDWKTAHEIANVVKYFPSADVVEVVRCKDCKFWSHNVNYSYHWCGGRLVNLDDYCSNGVRKDG